MNSKEPKMTFKHFLLQSLSTATGLLIFVLFMYAVLQLFSSEGFRKLWYRDTDLDNHEEDGFEEIEL